MTVLEHFLALPGEYRDRATRNCLERRKDNCVGTLSEAIMDGFSWVETEEGEGFWLTMHDVCYGRDTVDVSQLPPIPEKKAPVMEKPKAKEIVYKIDPKTATTYTTKLVTYNYE